jgi:hypothetical protein
MQTGGRLGGEIDDRLITCVRGVVSPVEVSLSLQSFENSLIGLIQLDKT